MSGGEAPGRTGSLTVRAGAATDVGRVRDHNEDSLLADRRVFAVADGMGGHAAGEVASNIAVQTLAELAHVPRLRRQDLVEGLTLANRRILESVRRHPEQAGMGTTVTGVAVVDESGSEHWAVFNLGDSRVYRFADDRLSLLTVDHSEVQHLVDAGLITPQEALRHPLRNVVTRSLGLDTMPEVDVELRVPEPGERFVVCSDGLNGELSDDELAELLRRHDDPDAAAAALVQAAVDVGGRDNVSVVVVDVQP
ncbi:PP2C family protein-serine/threonine phosphatase [Pedococcus sp. 5OH_020]|uniref:PP2C family protein-serine/threonine phosphatase n=1 Tax=Pedococcus sp. 5OH_020 TaxID=2989814 RepID=UPI0022E9E958|nr:protein phosphatase 2C domain-containing protein [Pedococcus sp. 5OH_020]